MPKPIESQPPVPRLHSVKELDALGFSVVAKGETGEIFVYGDIGETFWGDGVTARDFAAELRKLKGVKQIDLRINSDGGSVFEADAMYALLRAHGARIFSYIDGHAASAASFLAMAGDEIIIAEHGFLMIHEAAGGVRGTATAMRSMADLIDRVSIKIAQIYAARTGQPLEKVQAWMSADAGNGTWFDAQQCLDLRFANRMTANLKIAASVKHPEFFPTLPVALRPRRAAVVADLAALSSRVGR